MGQPVEKRPRPLPSAESLEQHGLAARADARLPHYENEHMSFSVQGTLPDACLRCGTTKDVKHGKHIFVWLPPLVYLGIPLGIVPYIIGKMIWLQQVEPVIPLCATCRSSVTTADLVRSFSPGIIVLVLGSCALFAELNALHLGNLWWAASIVALFFIYRRFISGKRLIVTRIHEGVITLKGISGEAGRAMCRQERVALGWDDKTAT